MKKLKSSLLNMVLSLTIIAVTMSAILGFVYISTKDRIAKEKDRMYIAAMRKVLPEFNNNPMTDTLDKDGMMYYCARKDSTIVGYSVIAASAKGFRGNISLMIGFLPGGIINDIAVIDQKETPGLGSRITNSDFTGQFLHKDLSQFKLHVKKDGGDVDALTGATISSRAFCDAVKSGYDGYMKDICKKEVSNKSPEDTCDIKSESVLSLVMPGFDNHPLENPITIDENVVYTCTKSGKILGYAVKSYSEGYHSIIWILAGFLPDGSINKIIVLRQDETEGLGAEVTSEKFLNQFGEKNPKTFKVKVKDDGGDVDAVSGATISSRAFCVALDKATKTVRDLKIKN